MGNQIVRKSSVSRKSTHEQQHGIEDIDGSESDQLHMSRKKSRKYQTIALIKLFEKLELTADGDNAHPGELTKATFENAFHGPLHKFGKLMYLQMMTNSSTTNRERITREQFVKAGREILKMFDEKVIVKYYYYLFASSKDHLNKEDARQMFEISFALTLSLSKILYQEDERDPRVFMAMVTGLFGINTEVTYEEFNKWVNDYCPHLFHCVHNWVCQVLTGSSLPEEMEMARVPHLEGLTAGNNCTSMAILWLLSLTLPPIYTKQPDPYKPDGASASSATKDPMWTSMLLLRKIARLPEVQSWRLLYNSDNHGMSINRFNNHVSSYHAPTVTFFAFEGRNLYCLAIDRGWAEGPAKFGGVDCRLIQLLPVYRVIQAGEKMIRWSEHAREIPKGITVGCEGKAQVLRLSVEFDKIYHYEVPCELHKIEVWGCGTETALKAQENQRKWEASAIRKEQSRKLRPQAYGESWDDSPDKQILQWGGVDVGNHSYNR
ncbi:unnamed protein product [Lymnaea stagnalis]|uniref:TLDc domain-containing protein n=1 Tax=Lymnaea stagnalis TaxID=6523 RepID=A0AAV2HU41_LYMST